MKPGSPGVARRYAKALLEVAMAAGDPATLGRDLTQAAELLQNQGELRKTLAHPAIPAERKRALAAAVFKGTPDLFFRLLILLVERERTLLLPDIARAYALLWNAQRDVVAARASTATPLSGQEARALAAALGRVTGKTVEVENTLDESLLGGALVEMDGRTFDGTVRGRLRSLRERLRESPDSRRTGTQA